MKKVFESFGRMTADKGDGKFSVKVWNREYVFDKSFLPTSIISDGRELLASPIKLNMTFGEESGEFRKFAYVYYEESDERFVVLASAECGNTVVNATVTFEFDGFIKVELRVSNFWCFCVSDDDLQLHANSLNEAALTSLSIDIPMKKETASLFHYWPNAKTSILPAGDVMNSGKTVYRKYPFKPYIWMGDERRGLGFWCESDCGFETDDEDGVIEVQDKNGINNIHIHIIDHMPFAWKKQKKDEWVNTLRPLFYTFGFQATPVKPITMSPDDIYKRFHLYDVMKADIYNSDILDRVAESGARWLILHEDWTAVQNFGLPSDIEGFRKFVIRAHNLGLKVMVYFGYEYSSLAPSFSQNADGFLIKNTVGNFTGGWQRDIPQRAYMVCYRGGYSDVQRQRIRYVMDEFGVDGIYTDGTYVPWECANEAHGCGYRDDEGNLHTTFPILAVREHVKAMYEDVHERGGIIDTHQSACCVMPTLSFADSYFDGENIQGAMVNDINFLSLDAFRCEYMGLNMGLTNNFLTYIDFDKVAAVSLIHNVMPRVNRINELPKIKKIWDIYDKYNLNSAKWLSYFDGNGIKCEDTVVASVYDCKEYKVVVATGYDKNGKDSFFDFCGEFDCAEDLLTDKEYELKNGEGILPVRYFAPSIYLVCRKQREIK
ncbi:MAG: DUF6067 family protein [Eubacteriales bacterium]|nr:DUF6067 family protein [Eubacteriales bacterium]